MYPAPTRSEILGTLLAFALTASLAFAQGGLPVRIDAPNWSKSFGDRVASGEDLTLDGLPDVIVLDPEWVNADGDLVGALYAYRGFDGLFLWKVEGLAPNQFTFEATTNMIADINNDGYADVFVGMPRAFPGAKQTAGQIDVRSGRDGSLIYQIIGTQEESFLGRDIESIGDVTGDDIPDFAAVTSYREDGLVTLYSGLDGTIIREISVAWPNSIANVGDLTKDDKNEILIGQWGIEDRMGLGALLVSGSDGLVLNHFFEEGLDHYGYMVGGGGDLDGDDVPDFGVTNTDHSEPELFVYSGADGELLQRITAVDYSISADVAIGDIDGDGKNEILMSSVNNYDIYRLGEATPFRQYLGGNGSGQIRGRETALADLNGDGRLDFILVDRDLDGQRIVFGAGSGITLGPGGFEWNTVTFKPYSLRRGRPNWLNTYDVTGATPGKRIWVLYSFEGKDCTFVPQLGICIDLTSNIQILHSAFADAGGTAEFSFAVPRNAPLDLKIWFQAVQVNHDVFGPVTSNVMEAIIVK